MVLTYLRKNTVIITDMGNIADMDTTEDMESMAVTDAMEAMERTVVMVITARVSIAIRMIHRLNDKSGIA